MIVSGQCTILGRIISGNKPYNDVLVRRNHLLSLFIHTAYSLCLLVANPYNSFAKIMLNCFLGKLNPAGVTALCVRPVVSVSLRYSIIIFFWVQ